MPGAVESQVYDIMCGSGGKLGRKLDRLGVDKTHEQFRHAWE
jgi:hypothetical protein